MDIKPGDVVLCIKAGQTPGTFCLGKCIGGLTPDWGVG